MLRLIMRSPKLHPLAFRRRVAEATPAVQGMPTQDLEHTAAVIW
jgi:hypothetical protein